MEEQFLCQNVQTAIGHGPPLAHRVVARVGVHHLRRTGVALPPRPLQNCGAVSSPRFLAVQSPQTSMAATFQRNLPPTNERIWFLYIGIVLHRFSGNM